MCCLPWANWPGPHNGPGHMANGPNGSFGLGSTRCCSYTRCFSLVLASQQQIAAMHEPARVHKPKQFSNPQQGKRPNGQGQKAQMGPLAGPFSWPHLSGLFGQRGPMAQRPSWARWVSGPMGPLYCLLALSKCRSLSVFLCSRKLVLSDTRIPETVPRSTQT